MYGRTEINSFISHITGLRGKLDQIETKDSIPSSYTPRKSFMSGNCLKKLLSDSYWASLIKTEGKTTHMRIHCHFKGIIPASLVGFSTKVDTDPDNLAKLAQGVHEDCALSVVEEAGVPKIAGIIHRPNLMRELVKGFSFSPEGLGTTIIIREPGSIEFFEPPLAFSLKRGRSTRLLDATRPPAVQQWMNDFRDTLSDRLRIDESGRDWCKKHYSIDVLVGMLLREIVDQQHGGIIVVSPELTDLFKGGYRVNCVSLREAIKTHWENSWDTRFVVDSRINTIEKDELIGLTLSMPGSRIALEHSIKGIARLANIDGCVVFNRDLILTGYGRMIQAQTKAANSQRVLKDRRGFTLDPQSILSTRGSRHLSAYQLCQSTSGVLAFVISQDGDVRLFASTDESVYYYDNLRS